MRPPSKIESEKTHTLYAQFLNFKPRKGDLRKVAIIEAAIESIAVNGIEQTSFESIGKLLKIGRAHVAYYFPNKSDLIEAAVKFVISTVQTYTVDHVKAAQDPRAKLIGFVNGTFEWMHTFPKHPAVIMLMYYYATHDKKYRKLHSEVRELGATRLAALVDLVLPRSKRATGPLVAKQVQNIMTGNIVDYITTDAKWDLESLRLKTVDDVMRLVDSFSRR